MSDPDDNEELEERSFFQKHRIAFGVGMAVVLGAVGFVGKQLFSGQSSAPRKAPEFSMIKLAPLPPPPPPPPQQKPPEQKIEQKMIEQAPVEQNEPKPDDKPKEEPPAAVSTNITGNGPDGFGLASGRGGNNFLGGSGRKGGGTRWGWYAGQVQTTIAEAMRKNPRTHNAALSIQVRIWPDSVGRITRAQLVGSTGDPAVDNILKSEVLTGLRLSEPPPAGMPLPIVLRLTARRPN